MENVEKIKEIEIKELAKNLEKELQEIVEENIEGGYIVTLESVNVYKYENDEITSIDYLIYTIMGEISENCVNIFEGFFENDENLENPEKEIEEFYECFDNEIEEINSEYAMKNTIVKTPYFTIEIEPYYCERDYCRVGGFLTITINTIEPEIIKDFIPSIKQILESIIPYSF